MLETEISIQVIFDAFTVGKYILKVPELRSNQPVNSPCQRVSPLVPSPPHRNALFDITNHILELEKVYN
ncbi:hypothetical protein HanRHA438_Chr09g0427211 [Helianthus annuus]|nr:hypothetical protein HanRHA438_Chr09g0427211 [Helianthus annuus]